MWASGILTLFVTTRRWGAAATLSLVGGAAALAFPGAQLAPAAATEGILGHMVSHAPFALLTVAVAAAMVVLTPFLVAARHAREPLLLGIGVSFLALTASPLVTDAPVALVGYGGSGTVGVFAAMALVMQRARREV